jgi:hypothetical protein
MASKLIKSSARILGGSAIAGIGLSFGRDIYRKAKKHGEVIVCLLFFLGAIIGVYIGGVCLARNYQSIWGSIFKKIGGLIILIPSFAILFIVGSLFTLEPSSSQESDAEGVEGSATVEGRPEIEVQESTAANAGQRYEFSVWPIGSSIGPYYLPCGVLLVGLVVGGFQRTKRTIVWDAEQANKRFMEDNGLIEHEDETIEDASTGEHYRIDHIGIRRITLFPIGSRGKRAYINIESNGKYSDFTGIVSTED